MTPDADWMSSLIRPDVAALDAYTPIQPFDVLSRRLGLKPEQIVKLDANENPYGPAPAVLEALAEYSQYHIYPDPEQTELRSELAEYLGVPIETILATHGADEILDYVCRLFIEGGDAVINCRPTFGMYRFDARINGAELVDVWRCDDFSVDVDAVERAVLGSSSGDELEERRRRVKIVFVTSPNNPTGNSLPDEALRRLLSLPVLVVLDEAYVEFSGRPSRVSWVSAYANLMVVRTFSKVAGMAGLRLGYAVCPTWLMPHLWTFKQPYNVNVAAAVAGLASLRSRDAIEETASFIRRERARLLQLLTDLPMLEPWPSEANFILCRVMGLSALELKRDLERQGVMVRHYTSPGLEDCIRISVGRPEHTDRLIQVLRSIA